MNTRSSDTIVGIDLGTTNSTIGIVESGFPILLANENGERLTSSVVWYPEDGGAPKVGGAAERAELVEPSRVVRSVKRLMGRKDHGEKAELPVIGGGKRVTPEEVSAQILASLKATAEQAQGEPVTRAVVTVPAYFNDSQRNATKAAAELAGFAVERIINEPTAAALAYGLDKLSDQSKIAVYDFGGGTFDISILELNAGVFQVLATNGDPHLGGDDIDHAIAEWILEKIAPRDGRGQGGAEQRRIFEAARQAKIELSKKESTTIRLPFFEGVESIELELSRDEFEGIAEEVWSRTVACCERAMSDAGVAPSDLDEIVLVGGSTKIPAVRALVASVFGQEPNVSQNPDEAVGLGAAIQAGILSGSVREVILLDVTPLSLGIETFGGLMNVIIPRNTTIPAKAGEMFTNAVAGQDALVVRVLQGERELAKDNWQLGEFTLSFKPGSKGSARVGVQFKIDENGILEVLARDSETGIDHIHEIRDSAVNVDDAAVESMIEESVEHAFKDFAERRLVELRQKAEELLVSVDAAIQKLEGQVDSGVLSEIANSKTAVLSSLELKDESKLKSAVDNLETASDPLATLLIEQILGGNPS